MVMRWGMVMIVVLWSVVMVMVVMSHVVGKISPGGRRLCLVMLLMGFGLEEGCMHFYVNRGHGSKIIIVIK